ncbi:MAG: hypothetical protein RL211_113 [Pseudomonadota bacterium]|jgi:hypothetical protein
MYIVPIAWVYVALMMAVVEAISSTGTLLGAVFTFVLYGLGPVTLVVYLMGSPARKRAIRAKEAKEVQEARAASEPSDPPDAGGHAPAAAQRDAVTPMGKEP